MIAILYNMAIYNLIVISLIFIDSTMIGEERLKVMDRR